MVLIQVHTPRGELRVEVGPGETWDAAARRATSDQPGRPVARDLSADPAHFVLEPDRWVTLRAATRGDLRDLVRWRQTPQVLKWWVADGEPTPERVTEQYLPDIDQTTGDRLWIVELNGRSVGFLSDYRISDHPDYALLTPDPAAIGVDYAIGEPAWIGRGLGAAVLWEWMRGVRERFPDAVHVFAAPDHRNRASVRVLEKVGFVPGTWFDEPQPDGSVATVIGCTADLRHLLD